MTLRSAIALCAALASIAVSDRRAHAYHNADFATPVTRGGGSGLYFTGSPRHKRLDCTACHALSKGRIGIELQSDPAELVAENRWTPGQTYRLTVTMTGEHLGDSQSSTSGYDHNSFVAEINDDQGRLAGTWASRGAEIFTMDVAGGDPQIVGAYSADGGTTWSLELTAPAAGTGRITLYMGAVDGNAAGGGVATVVDPFGDDVFVGAWRFCEGAQACDTGFAEVTEQDIDGAHASPTTGCSATTTSSGWLSIGVLLLLLMLRRRALGVVGVAALVGLGGCLDDGSDPVFGECPNGICEYTSEGEPLGTNPDLDRNFYRCEVQPVLQARCANFACHGDARRPFIVYTPFRLRLDGIDEAPTTPLELQNNFDATREFVRDDTPADSLLLLKPLDSAAGGYYHFGESLYYQSDVFKSTAGLGYQKLLDWISGATASADCEPTSEVGL